MDDIAFAYLVTGAFWALFSTYRGIKNHLRTKRQSPPEQRPEDPLGGASGVHSGNRARPEMSPEDLASARFVHPSSGVKLS
jgi:hypothetical protein